MTDQDENVDELAKRKRHEAESMLADLKMRKSRSKAVFTRHRNRLQHMINEEASDDELKRLLDKLEEALDNATSEIQAVAGWFRSEGRTDEMIKTVSELDTLNSDYDDIMVKYHEYFKDEIGVIAKGTSSLSVTPNPSTDMYKQLSRVTIPVFNGTKKDYEFWWSAFTACVDSTNATAEYKFLQLRQYLGGVALKAIEGLGHSASAYEAAKERLERKFGGKRRKVNRFLEELDKFPVMKEENAKSIEQFADLLDIAMINMHETDENELSSKYMYLHLLKKLPESMITRFQRWTFEKYKEECLDSLKEWVVRESEFHMIAMETKYGLDTKQEKYAQGKQGQRAYFTNNKTKRTCKVCGESHGVWECDKFKSMTVSQRWDKAKDMKLCFRCLGDNHMGGNCKRIRKCGVDNCVKIHHRLLHKQQLNPHAEKYEPPKERTYTNVQQNVYVALRTVPVVISANNLELQINALLDDGSTKTYINEDIAEHLGLNDESLKETVTVTTLNGRKERLETYQVKFNIKSVDESLEIEVEANTTQQVTGNLRPIDWNTHSKNWPHLRGLQFPSVGKKSKVDLLIGLDYAELHRSMGEIIGGDGSPTARLTPLGWTCVGPVELGQNVKNETTMFTRQTLNTVDEDVNDILKKFWEVESVETNLPQMNISEEKVVKLLREETMYDEKSQRYVVPVPWKDNKCELKNNYEMAVKRLDYTEKKLQKDPELYKTYSGIIEKYEKKGYVSKIVDNDNIHDNNKWYLPHFPVIRMDKATTKVRMVFDASARYSGICLNDVIHQGPKLQNELFDVLLRFRKDSIAIVCDIEEMYLQVGMFKQDRKYHSFLWRNELESKPTVYEFNRVVFGVNTSPFLAQYVSQENARKHQHEYPLAAKSVMKSTYMDDTMDSVENSKIGITLYKEMCALWQKAGMNPKKWMSNSQEVLAHIPKCDRAFQIDLSKDELPCIKTLGMNWVSESDIFTYHHSELKTNTSITKRNVLKKIASLFDPLGFLVPFTVKAKIIMQKIWLTGLDWDDRLPDELVREIVQYFWELKDLDKIEIPRCLRVKENSEIHTFVDASNDAYGAVVYHTENGQSTIIASKGRVAPIKTHSIPRLELMGAVLGLALTMAVCKALEIDLKKATFWTDSMNVLHWIHNQSRQFKPFVANRIGTIHQSSTPNQWRYVPSKQNPADLASRGESISNLAINEIWWQGPEFLKQSPDCWPEMKIKSSDIASLELKKKSMTHTFLNIDSKDEEFRLNPKRFSSFNRLVRISAWVRRFIDNCQVTKNERRLSPELSVHELEQVENQIFIDAQSECFSDEYKILLKGKQISVKSKLAPLNPKLDSEGVMRSDSRLKFANVLSYDAKFPILLPRKHWITKLVVKQCHEKTYHAGINSTLTELSKRFWVMSAREEIRELQNSCTMCKLNKAKVSKQIMGALPKQRTDIQ